MPEIKKIRIFIVDDHPIVYEGLQMLIKDEQDMEVCGTADNANSAIQEIPGQKPDIVIADISLKGGISGIDMIKMIKSQHPGLCILALSMHDETLYAERAIRAGARGYIMKNEMTGTIVRAIRQIIGGKLYLSESMSSRLLDELIFDQAKRIGHSIEKLTDRELEILELIGRGHRTSDIAKQLNVSVKTIDTHRLRIKKKLKLKNSAELVKYAIEWVHEK